MHRTMRVLGVCLSVAFVLLAGSMALAQNTADDKIAKSFQVGPGGTLTVDADLGTIEVQSAEGNQVAVDVIFKSESWSTRRLKEFIKEFQVDFRQTGNDVLVTAEYERHSNFWDSIGRRVQVRFVATVPKKYNVDLHTSGGSISVDDLEGEVRSETSGGSLKFGTIQGPIFGKTSGGSIRLEGCDGTADVKTSGGSIHLGKVKGDVNAHTSGGSINVQEMTGAVNASTSGGFIRVTLTEQPKENCRLTTSGGSITVDVAEKIGLNVDASTSGGHVSTDFPITVQGKLDNHALQAKINGGGPELYLHTSGGSIHLSKM